MAMKARSRFWVVSTHVLTTGFVMPFLASIAGVVAIAGLGVQGRPAWFLALAILAVGYVGGAYYSLSYVRKNAIVENWSACTVPAIVTFVVFAALGLAMNIAQLPKKAPLAVVGLVIFYALVVIAFAAITRGGFRD